MTPEYDKVVYDAAVKYFSYGARRPRSYTITDGAKYVRSAAMAKRGKTDVPRWNYVVQDCFSAGELPVELFTQEFWYNVQDIITDDGLVVMVSSKIQYPLTTELCWSHRRPGVAQGYPHTGRRIPAVPRFRGQRGAPRCAV